MNQLADYWADVQNTQVVNVSQVNQNTSAMAGDYSATTYLYYGIAVIAVAAILLVAGRFIFANVRVA